MKRLRLAARITAACLLSSLAAAAGAGVTMDPPGPITVLQGGSAYITASLPGNSAQWLWLTSGGSITPLPPYAFPTSTAYYAENGVGPGTYTVQAIGAFGQRGTVTVTVPPVTVTVDPLSPVAQHESRTLVAHVAHAFEGVTWSVNPLAGAISGNTFTAGSRAGTWLLTATSQADPSASGTTHVTVLPPVSVTISPGEVSLAAQGTQQFVATVENSSNPSVTWSVDGGGSVNSQGLYTAGALGGSSHVTAASVADPSATATASVHVVSVGVTPASIVVPPGSSRQFFAQVAGSTQPVTWSTNAPGATLTPQGVFTPSASTPSGSYTVTARTAGLPTVAGSATAIVSTTIPVGSVALSPPRASVRALTQLWLSAVVVGQNGEPHPNQGVTWSVNAPGSVSSAGVFAAPDSSGTYTVTATSLANGAKFARSTLTVPREVELSPSWERIAPGASASFEARALGVGNPAVTWSVLEAGGGTVTNGGVYTAPQLPGTYHVVARSLAATQISAAATVTVTPEAPVSVSVDPPGLVLERGATYRFSALVHGTTNAAVNWSASDGTIDATGFFTAPQRFGTVRIGAVSQADPAAWGWAAVVVSDGTSDQTFEHDANGNLLSDGQRQFEWDAENRLIAVVQDQQRSEFAYDALGRRFLITERSAGALVGRRRYLWYENRMLEERDSPPGAFSLPGEAAQLEAEGISLDAGGRALPRLEDDVASDAPTVVDDAIFVSQSVPVAMTAGGSYAVALTFRNSGTRTWTAAAGQALGSRNPPDNTIWGLPRVFLDPADAVAPNQQKTFTFSVTAPLVPGTYTFRWRMVTDPSSYFGTPSPITPVTVTAAPETVLTRFYFGGIRTLDGDYFLVRDQVGSVRAVVDANGALVSQPRYDPFGRLRAFELGPRPPLAFAGYFKHEISGLSLAVHRAYDPDLGRWLNRDPIAEAGGLNLYQYVGNDPGNRRDPLGLCPDGTGPQPDDQPCPSGYFCLPNTPPLPCPDGWTCGNGQPPAPPLFPLAPVWSPDPIPCLTTPCIEAPDPNWDYPELPSWDELVEHFLDGLSSEGAGHAHTQETEGLPPAILPPPRWVPPPVR